MKKITFLVLLLSVCISQYAEAQTWAPANAKWTYGMANPFGPEKYYETWIVTGDTVIDGKTCSIIQVENKQGPQDLKFITYEEDNVVFWYNFNDTFTVLYDFNKSKGQGWTIWNDTCGMTVTVDSTGIENINGKALKTLYISLEHGDFGGKTIQYIGNLSRPFPLFQDNGCNRSHADVPYITELRCYEDATIGLYNTGLAPSCYYVGIEEKKSTLAELKLFPNPAKDKVYLQANQRTTFTYQVYNLSGQLVLQGRTTPELTALDVSTLQNGFYLLQISAGNFSQRECFIINK